MKKIFLAFIVIFSLTFIGACTYSTNTYDNAISVGYDQDFVEYHYNVESCNDNHVTKNVHQDTKYGSYQDYSYETSYYSRKSNTRTSNTEDYSQTKTENQKNLPLVYYGSDRGFVSDSRYLNQGTPSNINSENYYYKYSPYFGGYYESYKCYDSPPKNKLFYIRCP